MAAEPRLGKPATIAPSFFREIVESSLWGHLIFDLKNETCIYANKKALEVMGFEDMNFKFSALAACDLREGQKTIDRELLGRAATFEDVFLMKTNQVKFLAQVSVMPLSEQVVLLAFQDITFQKKLQRELTTKQAEFYETLQELEKQNADLRELDKAKDRFIALISHELRTPISAILATAQFVHDGLADNPEEVLQHVDVMLDEAKHLLEMVNDILDFQKIQMGKSDLYVEELDVLEILKQSVENMEKFAAEKSTSLIIEGPVSSPKIYCDPVRMAQVFYNVLSNAVKFGPENSKVIIRVASQEDKVVLSFQDFGKGIPEDQEQKVFNEFETIENIRSHHKGTGLGMPICKRLMESIGGKIYFKSESGQGTTFFIEIPTKRVLAEDMYRKRSPTGDLAA